MQGNMIEKDSPAAPQGAQSSTRSSLELFAELNQELRASALKHYMTCPNAAKVEQQRLESSRWEKKEDKSSCYSSDETVKQLELWLQREQIIRGLQNMHELWQDEYILESENSVCGQHVMGKEHERNFSSFLRSDFARHSQAGLAMIIRKLLELWGLIDNEQILDSQEVTNFGVQEIQRFISAIREQLETASTLQNSIVQHFAIENYLSRISAVSTLESNIERRRRSSILKEIKSKPRFMMHVGGVVLNLMQENIQKIGRNVDVVDLKGKYQEKVNGVASLPSPTAFMGVVTYGNKIYISGGRNAFGQFLLGEDDSQGVKDQMLMISMRNQGIKVKKQMTSKRSHHGFVSFRGDLWAIGGSDGTQPVSSVEYYDVIKNAWRSGPSLPLNKSCFACVTYKDSIWVIGGRDHTNKILNEVHALEGKTWVKKINFPVPIMLSSAIVINNRLYVTGGVTGTLKNPHVLADIFTYNDSLRQWEIWTTMSHSRMNHSTAFYGSYLIIIGGHTMQNMVPKEIPGAICYDTSMEDKKENTTPMLGTSRIGLGVAMFGDPRLIEKVCSDSPSSRTGNSRYQSTVGLMSSDSNGGEEYQLLCSQSEEGSNRSPQLNFLEYITSGKC